MTQGKLKSGEDYRYRRYKLGVPACLVQAETRDRWREGDIADVHTFRDGKILQARVFADPLASLEWAEAQATAAHKPECDLAQQRLIERAWSAVC